jgi:hypothetical protein
MTDEELRAVIAGIAPVIRAAIGTADATHKALLEMIKLTQADLKTVRATADERIAAIELVLREAIRASTATLEADIAMIRTRLAAVETPRVEHGATAPRLSLADDDPPGPVN